jgi:hypothetical protein
MEFLDLINEILYVVAFLKARMINDNRQGSFFLHDCLNLANLRLVVAHPVKLSDGLCDRRAIGTHTG